MNQTNIFHKVLILLIGALFIFSGMIKVIDPIGTAIKLKEYFEVFTEDFASFFHYFIPFALPLAIIVVVLEVVLGVALLVNYKRRLVINALALMIIFFTFLTFYSAYFNKVTDCGCFGDAIKLTPWESFSKDVILLVMIGILFVQQRKFPNTANFFSTIATGLALAVGFGVCWYALEHLPPIDFRPYKVGENIQQNMEPRGTPDIVYTFKKEGETLTSREWMKKEEGYEYISSEVVNEDDIQPRITDYSIMDAAGDIHTETSLEGEKLLVVIDLVVTADQASLALIGDLVNDLTQANVQTMVLTADMDNAKMALADAGWTKPAIYAADATVLKAMIRANPGIMVLQNGTVKGKWHYNDTPTATDVLKALGK